MGTRMGTLLCDVGEVSLTSIPGARRLCFLSALVEVGGFAFLAAELDDVAEGAIGGVADQPKTTATVGAPLHAILPSLQFLNPPERRATRRVDVLLHDVLTYAFQA